MYVTDGASFNPKLNPKMVNIKQMIGNEWLKPRTIQPIVSGNCNNIMVFRRPIRSLIGPLSKLPIGCAKCEKVAEKSRYRYSKVIDFFFENYIHNQDACEAEIDIVSSGFSSLLSPVNEGMTSAEKPRNSPILTIMRLFAIVPKIYKKDKEKPFYFPTFFLSSKIPLT